MQVEAGAVREGGERGGVERARDRGRGRACFGRLAQLVPVLSEGDESAREENDFRKEGGKDMTSLSSSSSLNSSSSSSSESECSICFERPPSLHFLPCTHSICAHCCLALCCHAKGHSDGQLALPAVSTKRPPACPFCRQEIEGIEAGGLGKKGRREEKGKTEEELW